MYKQWETRAEFNIKMNMTNINYKNYKEDIQNYERAFK